MAKRKAKRVIAATIGPTPERLGHGGFEQSFVHHAESGTKVQTYAKNPWHVTQYNRGNLTKTQCGTIAQYVHQWDIAQRSPIKSNLDRSIGGGDGPSNKLTNAKLMLAGWNRQLGKPETRLIELVACEGLGYAGASAAVFGDQPTDYGVKQTSKWFGEIVDRLAKIMA